MHQSLCGFISERVHRKKTILESLDAGLEETLDFIIQIEKPDAQKPPQFFADCRFTDTTDTRQKYTHLYTLFVVFTLPNDELRGRAYLLVKFKAYPPDVFRTAFFRNR
jgi:hypothetical protein